MLLVIFEMHTVHKFKLQKKTTSESAILLILNMFTILKIVPTENFSSF